MTGDNATRSGERNPATAAPPLGTPEYQDYIDQQGQAAMDAALAHPCIRAFAGVFFALGLMFCLVLMTHWVSTFTHLAQGRLESRSLDWRVSLVLTYVTIELGAVTLFGRSRLPLYRLLVEALRRAYRRPRSGP